MARRSWVLSNEFWAKAERLIPPPRRDPHKSYLRKPGGGRKRANDRLILSGIFYVLRTGCQWNAVPGQFGASSTFIVASWSGLTPVSLKPCGALALLPMQRWATFNGSDSVSMARQRKPH